MNQHAEVDIVAKVDIVNLISEVKDIMVKMCRVSYDLLMAEYLVLLLQF